MHRTSLGISVLLLGLLIAVLEYLANAYYLYWLWWWADIVMHFLGGLFVGLAILWWVRFEIPISIRSRVPRFTAVLFGVLLVGIAWEILEYFTGLYAAYNYPLDTASDLLMDVVGALTAYLVFYRYGK